MKFAISSYTTRKVAFADLMRKKNIYTGHTLIVATRFQVKTKYTYVISFTLIFMLAVFKIHRRIKNVLGL